MLLVTICSVFLGLSRSRYFSGMFSHDYHKKCTGLGESTLWKPRSDKEYFGELGNDFFVPFNRGVLYFGYVFFTCSLIVLLLVHVYVVIKPPRGPPSLPRKE